MGKKENVDLADEIEKLNQSIGLPKGLGEMGVTEEMIPHLVAHSIQILVMLRHQIAHRR